MFTDFFFHLRQSGVPISTREFLDFLKVMEVMAEDSGVISFSDFYLFAKTTLVKDIKFYDAFNQAFAAYFSWVEGSEDLKGKFRQWLEEAKKRELSAERRAKAQEVFPKDLIDEIKKRLQEQKERHDGGNFWIGTGGTSAFGNSGFNASGVRVGGQSSSRSGLAVMGDREFKDYRGDADINTRNIKVALKKLRKLKKSGRSEIDINKSIFSTVEQAGEVQIEESPVRKNDLKIVMLFDIGGSMTIHSDRVEKLFSAAHNVDHFKQFKSYYFHNTIYGNLYHDARMTGKNSVAFDKFLRLHDKKTKLIIVGDAAMAPYELFQMTGDMMSFYRTFSEGSGDAVVSIERLYKLKKHFEKCCWLNPDEIWSGTTQRAIREIFPMHRLTLSGLNLAVKELIR